ncbi:peptide/nickel transport system substrate-binding protein [Humitalea rosea]|uniref:Peptide/nickel transport system substrate-binding protein n=1 Tax=Humitalea rosea TaxID=990373 RepID=A0A2W7KQI6_9PROT|nr:ABC transporter substrate-binding protein [Humitalea rosea]PZW50850.1 peptide/nickel transport system substrate-binding protein [Humitalea rosea]
MKRSFLASSLIAAAFALPAAPAMATPFQCPTRGGDLVFGQEANVNSLDQMTSSTISTRNIAMNIFETLMTRDENNNPILELAEAMEEGADGLSYTFKLRHGIVFHNGKPMTSADVAASFDRYKRIGLQRSTLDNVAGWDTPDPFTFIIRMSRVQPTFIEALSSFSVPIVIVPAEMKDDERQQLRTIGTGPFKLLEFVPGSHAKLGRYDGYQPNTAFEQRTGFGGYRVACLDTVTFRIVTEASARVAGLETGELQGVEDVPTRSLASLRSNSNITILPLQNWWIQIALPNTATPPTSNLAFRRAVQAALGMEDIMDAATDGNYRLNVGFQYPNQPTYTDAGKETYNINNAARARTLLRESGYRGEPIVILTNRDYPAMYNAALVMQQQMQAVGINASLRVVDWPTSVQMSQQVNSTEWHFFHSGWGTQPALGALATMQFLVSPGANYRPRDDKDDPDVLAAWNDMNNLRSEAERNAAYARMQTLVLERAYAYPFGALTKVQATRATVQNFVPFRIPRFSNVSMTR